MTDKPRPKIQTVCHDCRGDQVIYKPTLYVSGGNVGTISVPHPCPTCKGKGRLPGFQPPV